MQTETEITTPRDYRPRGRNNKKNKNTCKYKIADVYKFYYPTIVQGSRFDIPYREVKKIWTSYLKNSMRHIIEDAGELKLSRFIGTLRIRKIKTNFKKPKVDFARTIEHGKIVYHDNMHTNGYYIRFYWRPTHSRLEYAFRYAFLVERRQSRKASRLFRSGATDYFT